MTQLDQRIPPQATHAEQSLLGALLIDNDALDHIADLRQEHFYHCHHSTIFGEIRRQISMGHRADVISLFDALQNKIADCLPYLNQLAQSVGSSANIARYAEMIIDRSTKRALAALARDLQEMAYSMQPAEVVADKAATRIEELINKKTRQLPRRLFDMLDSYVDLIQDRVDGKIKPIATGFIDLDNQLDGGLERGTLSIVAARPSMGKTALALCLGRNVATHGSALFLSMEMSRDQVNDRNIAALGKVPLAWLRKPDENNNEYWSRMTEAFKKADELNLYIDDQTSLSMLDIRSKARLVKRRYGLDMLIIDQLSFITRETTDKASWEIIGEHTRSLLQLAKDLNVAIVLLCQLNRKCDDRPDKRPLLSDLALSGSIEQDAANILFLYRDEVYDSNTPNKGICEVNAAKLRQGTPGSIALKYIPSQTRFEDLLEKWQPQTVRTNAKFKGGLS